ncbi:MAG: chemotaxis protein CheD [Terracidiphilus sp.]|jgi:chemotaxis protein CheD
MAELDTALPELYVQPGESHVVREPTIMRTVLGSCVGVACMIRRLGVGALCHPMLPRYPRKPPAGETVEAGRRYVDFAIRDLARQFDSLGAHRDEVEVKLFGGGDVLLVTNEASRPTVGQMNCEAALRVLQEESFELVASSLGGVSGVNIQFNTGTGEVLLKRLSYPRACGAAADCAPGVVCPYRAACARQVRAQHHRRHG